MRACQPEGRSYEELTLGAMQLLMSHLHRGIDRPLYWQFIPRALFLSPPVFLSREEFAPVLRDSSIAVYGVHDSWMVNARAWAYGKRGDDAFVRFFLFLSSESRDRGRVSAYETVLDRFRIRWFVRNWRALARTIFDRRR